ncbi:Dihydropyrimidine dehydrogenase [NADP(+)] [Manis javanica]|nr:Dihydropyrimidine dehydrogenase [NADP(+)] [Manis javanica]
MADISSRFLGISSPNPFWLASAPPTDKEYNVRRAFEAGWGGVVWKTLGEDPHVVNVNGPRYSTLMAQDRRVMGLNNIELITDRPLRTNLEEMTRVKKAWPDRALVVSLMVPCDEESWKAILAHVEDTGADGVELNFGCPHGMAERGMGSAVGQVPEYIEMVTRWVKQHSRMPCIVKLTPNITDPIALNMVAEIARDPQTAGLPISGIGGITTWKDAAEYIALGCGNVQVCTAAMTYGFRVVQDMCDGLSNYMDAHGFARIEDFQGRAVPTVRDWKDLNLNHIEKAVINQDSCIQCGRCHVACEDTSHQAITFSKEGGVRRFEVDDTECVGCNLCVSICPARVHHHAQPAAGRGGPRTGQTVTGEYANWTTHPNNPMRQAVTAQG